MFVYSIYYATGSFFHQPGAKANQKAAKHRLFLMGGLLLDTLIILGISLGTILYIARHGYPSFEKIPRSIKAMVLGAGALLVIDASYGYYRFKWFARETRFQFDQLQNKSLDQQSLLDQAYGELVRNVSLNLEQLMQSKQELRDQELYLKQAIQMINRQLLFNSADNEWQGKLKQAENLERLISEQIKQTENHIQNLQRKGENYSIKQEEISSQIAEIIKNANEFRSKLRSQ